MYRVTVCVILAVTFGNVSCSVIRSRRDLEQTIFDIYGPPNVPNNMHRTTHPTSAKPAHNSMEHNVEETTVYIPQHLLDDIWGEASPVKPSEPAAGPTAPYFFSTFIANTRAKGLKDAINISSSPYVEAMNLTENSTLANNTGVDFDDRFLSPSVLQKQWNRNYAALEPPPILTKAGEPQKPSQPKPESPGEDQTGPFEHKPAVTPHQPDSVPSNAVPLVDKLPEVKSLQPPSAGSKPPSNNASYTKNTYSSFYVVLLYLFTLKS